MDKSEFVAMLKANLDKQPIRSAKSTSGGTSDNTGGGKPKKRLSLMEEKRKLGMDKETKELR
jgi:hypothetical protein